jgi:DNA-binding response OmpR family regulator
MEQFDGAARHDGLKVLVAEEDARLRRIVRLNLEREGFATLEAASLSECESALRQCPVGLVIISSQLPGFDGRRFSEWLRAQSPLNPIPVVVLSFEPEDRVLTFPLRVAAFRQKPFDPDDLVGQVSSLMRTA